MADHSNPPPSADIESVQLVALHRLLLEAQRGGEAKVDALVALIGREAWAIRSENHRTGLLEYTDPAGNVMLPVYSDRSILYAELPRYAIAQSGAHKSLDVRMPFLEAFRLAVAENYVGIVVDMHSQHSLAVARSEMEPFLTDQAVREAKSPFAVRGRLSSTLMSAMQSQHPAPPSHSALPYPSNASRNSEIDLLTALNLSELAEFDEALLEAFSDVLRRFPEVEWAAAATPCTPHSACTLCLRIEPSFRQRVRDLQSLLEMAAEDFQKTIDFRLLDDVELMPIARKQALVFYPWINRGAKPTTIPPPAT